MNWDRTRVWSEGGYYARVFFNVKGREPRGRRSSRPTTSGSATRSRRGSRRPTDPDGQPLGTLVFKPEEVYRDGPQRRPRPDRPLRRPGLAVDRRRRLSDDPRPGERHRARTTATTPSTARSSSPRRTTRSRARSRGPTCSTSRRRCSSWAATTSRRRCRAGRWSPSRPLRIRRRRGLLADDEEIVRDRLSGLGYLSWPMASLCRERPGPTAKSPGHLAVRPAGSDSTSSTPWIVVLLSVVLLHELGAHGTPRGPALVPGVTGHVGAPDCSSGVPQPLSTASPSAGGPDQWIALGLPLSWVWPSRPHRGFVPDEPAARPAGHKPSIFLPTDRPNRFTSPRSV